MHKETEKEFVEEGANLEHDRWARWQKYMFSKCLLYRDGALIIPQKFASRWFRQIDTLYSELSEEEKESDRKETRQYLELISQFFIDKRTLKELSCPKHRIADTKSATLGGCETCKTLQDIKDKLL